MHFKIFYKPKALLVFFFIHNKKFTNPGGQILKIPKDLEFLTLKTCNVNKNKAVGVKIKMWKIGESMEVGVCLKKWEGVVKFEKFQWIRNSGPQKLTMWTKWRL